MALNFIKLRENETTEQLGLSIRQLRRKAFPLIMSKDFDRLLKGGFYHGLLVTSQSKLGPPKAEEGCYDLYTHARLLEEHDKQYTAFAESRNANLPRSQGTKPKTANYQTTVTAILRNKMDSSCLRRE